MGGQRPETCLAISLQPAASSLRASDGRDVPFTRAILTVRNGCDREVIDLVPHATLGQEGGTVQDVSAALAGGPASLAPGAAAQWDVYDLLLPAHPGTASKVHMFGYRAALNWLFDLTVWAEFRLQGATAPASTTVARWTLRWSLDPATAGAVALTLEERAP